MQGTRWIAALAVAAILFGSAQAVRANFGAIAYSPSTGSYGYWHDAGNQCAAENGALQNCNGADRQVAVWVENGWAALAVNSNGDWATGWSGNSQEEAQDIAVNEAGGVDAGAYVLCWVYSGS